MFIQSSYKPKEKQLQSKLTICDVAVLAAQFGDLPFTKKGSLDHLTAGNIQLICYWAQGMYIATKGQSLFKDDFYIVNGRIENPKVTEMFGQYNKRVTPFNLNDELKSMLASRDEGFTVESNIFVKNVIFDIAPRDYIGFMRFLMQTKPYINALSAENNKIEKADIKEYFEGLLIRPINETWTLED